MVVLNYSDIHQLCRAKWKETKNIMKQTCNTVVTESGIFKLLVLTPLMWKLYYNQHQKVQPLSLLFVIYLYKFCLSVLEERNHSICPNLFSKSARCLSLLRFNTYDTFVHKMEYKLWRFRLTAGRSEITPFLLLYFQEVPGACPRMDSVYMTHLSTNWDTSYEGSAWQLASAK